jgi:hypothetical protein
MRLLTNYPLLGRVVPGEVFICLFVGKHPERRLGVSRLFTPPDE